LKKSLLFLTVLAVLSKLPVQAQPAAINTAWLPITDAERQMSQPVVDKNAGAEVLQWRVHVVDEATSDGVDRSLYHYVRLKIFNQQGVDKAATIDIPYSARTAILYVTGRTVKADGSIVELKKDAIHDKELLRASGIRVKSKSFAMPALEPGAIVEYRWKESRYNNDSVLYFRLQMQREFPVQKVTYFVKPLSREIAGPYRMTIWPFNCRPTPLNLENDGFNSMSLMNVPAFREEPMMPGEPNVRPWVLVFYHDDQKRELEKYWNEVGKEAYQSLKQSLKTNDELKAAAAKAVEGATGEERVLRLIRYIRSNFKELYDRSVSDADRAKILKQMPKTRHRTSAEVFKSGIGTSDELNTLFAALALEVGIDARPALVGSRSDLIFDPEMKERYFLRSIDMAVRTGETWKLYDVSTRRLPSSMVSWNEEGMKALLSDPKKPVFIDPPLSPPTSSVSARTARLKLLDDGTVQGDVEEIYTGHRASDKRLEFEGESEARQQERFKEDITKRYPQSEVTNIRVENVADPEKPFTIRYAIKIPGYAQRTGKRLFFQPLYFQRGAAPLFSAAEREYEIHFPYAWQEMDVVTITLPDGFALDNAENPGGLDFGAPGAYKIQMQLMNKNQLTSTRELVFGNKGIIVFPKTAYPQMKKLFDEIHRRDSSSLSLRQVAAEVTGQ
jgi:hypothetical protein